MAFLLSRRLYQCLISNHRTPHNLSSSFFSSNFASNSDLADSADGPEPESESESVPSSTQTLSERFLQRIITYRPLEQGLDVGIYKAIIVGKVGHNPIQKKLKNGRILTLLSVGTGGTRKYRGPLDHEEPIDYANHGTLDHEEPRDYANRGPLDHEEPIDYANRGTLDHEEPRDYANRGPLDHEEPRVYANRGPLDHEEPRDYANRGPLDHDEPRDYINRGPWSHEEPRDYANRGTLDHEEPGDYANCGPLVQEEPRDYANKRRCHVQWHRVSIHQKILGDVAMKHVVPGSILYVEGNLETKIFSDPVTGLVRHIREIAIRRNGRFVFLGEGSNGQQATQSEMSGVGYY